MSDWVGFEPCPQCGSKDNLGRHADGHGYCFGCEYYEHAKTDKPKVETKSDLTWKRASGDYRDLPDRALKEETLRFWKYQIAHHQGQEVHIANIYDLEHTNIGQKLRVGSGKNKRFAWRGESNDLLYGMWLWQRGKAVVITEGEIDALSVSQAQGLKWPVVSLLDGAQSFKKSLTNPKVYEWLDGFERIVLMFDMDQPGQKAVEKAVELLPAGKVFIAKLPEKDANDVLKKHGPAAITKAFWDAKQYRPDGIVAGNELELEKLMSAATKGYVLRTPDLNNRLLGLRKGEITLCTAGSGIGKSTLVRQIAYELHQDHSLKFGNVFLEENNVKTAQAYVALHNRVPLGKLRYDPTILTPEQWKDGYDKIVAQRMYFYNHFGSLESTRLISKLHYMATVLGVDFILLDHISIITSGLESSSEGERKDIDILMTRLRSLVEETGVGILGVVHLKRAQGKNYNEGDMVSLSDLRGSGALEQLSDNVLAMERNQQNDEKRDYSLVRVLKCRETGDTGAADTVIYDRETGLLTIQPPFNAVDDKEPVKL